MSGSFAFQAAELEAAFPFALAIDEDLKIVFAGGMLERLCAGSPAGRELPDVFQASEPNVPLAFLPLRERAGSQLTLRIKKSGIRICGPVVLSADPSVLLILTAPWFMDVAKLRGMELALEDYAVQTPLEDIQNILRGRTLALEDARRLNEELFTQREELQRANDTLREQGRKLEEYAAELRQGALHDYLTGLPNRLLFMNQLHKTLERSRSEENHLFAVLFADLDRFKLVNDSFGHLLGDRMLVEVGGRLHNCIRPGDTLARFGGDEFVFLLDDLVDPSEAIEIARVIQTEIEVPMHIESHELYTSISIGIAFSDRDYESPEEILRDADTALYLTKSDKRQGYGVFTRTMHGQARARLELERDLRRGLEDRQFHLNYQPIYNQNGELYALEALLRWEHPERGPISPAEFIPVAEDTGRIIALGGFALTEASRFARDWHRKRPGVPVFVNISAVQFRQANFAEYLLGILEAADAPPDCLGIELTESAILENAPQSLAQLKEFRERGIPIALDDFGTGYSSLAQLKNFPIDVLKIDRAFIMDLPNDAGALKITRAIIALGHGLGMTVTAEGVETSEQRDLLRAEGCDHLQGFLFHRPLGEEDARSLAPQADI